MTDVTVHMNHDYYYNILQLLAKDLLESCEGENLEDIENKHNNFMDFFVKIMKSLNRGGYAE